MAFTSKIIKSEYRSLIDNIVKDFYMPLLSDAVSYKRAVGFFSSTALIELSKGICSLAYKGGKIDVVASPYLSEDDTNAIRAGYVKREEVIESALLRNLEIEQPIDYYGLQRLNLLACLIADGILDIKIAFMEDRNRIGMYHEKMGIITDAEGNKVAFSGSMNESATAMCINYETIDVFRSWGDTNEATRVQRKDTAFSRIWNDLEPNIKVLKFPNISEAIIKKFKRCKPNYNIDLEQFTIDSSAFNTTTKVKNNPITKPDGPSIPNDIQLYDYQKEAIASWVSENYRGIFDMATGTGKTYTGLAAVAQLSQSIEDKLAVIIICPFQHLVEQWVEDIIRFNISPIIGYSRSPQKDWKKRFKNAVREQNYRGDRSFFCFVCTNATFASDFVQEQINKICSPILIVVDEAHNFGAPSYGTLLDDRFEYRLALSATLDRYRDDEGTSLLYNFFGNKCIEYTLERAISEGKLTPYKYYPKVVYLNKHELEEYERLSYVMSTCITKNKKGQVKLSPYGQLLAIERSRIIAGASDKFRMLRETIEPFVDDNNILVYCGATKVNVNNSDYTPTDESDIRQIDAVVKILGQEFGMKVARFTADEDMKTRTSIKEHFSNGEDLQAIVAIKCLDEGVNIPGIKTAFILASTTNPKEYIQRRGRVLRKARGKTHATIFDFVTLPRRLDTIPSLTKQQVQGDATLVSNELSRIEEFASLSKNPFDAKKLIWDIEDAYRNIIFRKEV